MENTLKALGITAINEGCSTGSTWFSGGSELTSYSPVDGKAIAKVKTATRADFDKVLATAKEAFLYWREIPAPRRGE